MARYKNHSESRLMRSFFHLRVSRSLPHYFFFSFSSSLSVYPLPFIPIYTITRLHYSSLETFFIIQALLWITLQLSASHLPV